MNGVFLWRDALGYFGDEIEPHAKALSEATNSTYGLLVCRSAQGGQTLMVNRDGGHAERRLMLSSLWTRDIDYAISDWYPHLSQPMVVLLAINRSPCPDCAHLLAAALHALDRKFALRCGQQHFVLASLGLYKGPGFADKRGQPDTSTERGFQELREAGWKPCVLDFGRGLTRRGDQLLEYLKY